MFNFYRTVDPASEVFAMDEVKTFVRVTNTKDEDLLATMIRAARVQVERNCNISLLTQSWRLLMDQFPRLVNRPGDGPLYGSMILLPRGPLQQIDQFLYTLPTTNAIAQLASPTDFTVDANAMPPRVFPAYLKPWPATLIYPNSVSMDYTTGSVTVDGIPEDLKLAMKIMIGHWYENREIFIPNQTVNKVPQSVEDILCDYRVFPFEVQPRSSFYY